MRNNSIIIEIIEIIEIIQYGLKLIELWTLIQSGLNYWNIFQCISIIQSGLNYFNYFNPDWINSQFNYFNYFNPDWIISQFNYFNPYWNNSIISIISMRIELIHNSIHAVGLWTLFQSGLNYWNAISMQFNNSIRFELFQLIQLFQSVLNYFTIQ